MEVIRKELETVTIMFVPVKDNWTDFRVFHKNGNTRLMINKEKIVDKLNLPNFSFINLSLNEIVNWKLLGDSRELTEEDLSLIGLNLEAFNSLKERLQIVDVETECHNQWCNNGVVDEIYGEKLYCSLCDGGYLEVRKHIVLFEAKK